MNLAPEIEQLRFELNEYADGRSERFKGAPLNPDASPAWKYGWLDMNDGLARSFSGQFLKTA